MIGDVLGWVFETILGLLMVIVKVLLLPIDALIATAIPVLSDGFTAVGDVFELIADNVAWAIDATGIPSAILSLLALYLIFKYTFPIQIWFFKLALKWYHTLKF